MNEEIENVEALLEHSKRFPKCVILDKGNNVFLIQASPNDNQQYNSSVAESAEYPTLVAVTIDLDEFENPVLFAINLIGPVSESAGARLPEFPVSILANR